MTATFTVAWINYSEHGTAISLGMGRVGSDRMGERATIEVGGTAPIAIRPGQVVRVTIEPVGEEGT